MQIEDTKNPAELMTKYLVKDRVDLCVRGISQEVRQGRASSGLDVQGRKSSKEEVISS